MEALLKWFGDNSAAISSALVVLIVPAFINGLLGTTKAKASKKDGLAWVEYGKTFKAFTVIGMMIPAGLISVWFNVGPDNKLPVLFMGLLFGGLIVPLFLEAFFVKMAFDDLYIYCYSPWRPSRKIGFSELGEPYYSQSLQWWVIPTESQGKIRLQSFISGAEELLEKVKDCRRG